MTGLVPLITTLWIPAFAGMTGLVPLITTLWIPACAGMTGLVPGKGEGTLGDDIQLLRCAVSIGQLRTTVSAVSRGFCQGVLSG